MEKLLFIDSCPRQESRTRELANYYLTKLLAKENYEVTYRSLAELNLVGVTEEIIEKRSTANFKEDFSDSIYDLAKELKEADKIILAAPYWDLSFPSILKTYIENIMVVGLTFDVDDKDYIPLCNSKELIYLTTAGGEIADCNFGYDYVCGIAKMIGLGEVTFIKAERLDLDADRLDQIMLDTKKYIDKLLSK